MEPLFFSNGFLDIFSRFCCRGRKEGRKEGRREGGKEGGREEGRKEGSKQARKGGREEGKKEQCVSAGMLTILCFCGGGAALSPAPPSAFLF